MYMQSDLIVVKVVDCAGTIIINRPDHGNLITRMMLRQLGEALHDLYYEKAVRAIILTGAGDSFCSGIDLEEMRDMGTVEASLPSDQQQWGEDAGTYRDLLLQMLETTKPIIAAVNGPAHSAGAGLVAASDVVIASAEASFGMPDPRHGLVAGVVAPLLCFRLGAGHAARLLLTAAKIGADEAFRLGVFHELVPNEKLWARGMQLAAECAAGSPECMQLTKRLLTETAGEQLATQLAAGAVMQATSCTTEAAREGIAAHLEGRMPEWK
jgi:enoyl-CoA hydratase/carnithine racemase